MWIIRKRWCNYNRRGIALLIFLTFLVTVTTADNTDVVKNNADINNSPLMKPNLPFGDINLLVVSDVHSFVGGHPHEPDRNADYGDLYSFHERLKEYINNNNNQMDGRSHDLWLLNNGDWLHGTGLAMDGNATNLLPIITSMPWDALNMGNHEAIYSDVLQDMKESMLPKFPGKYITSNVLWNNNNTTSDDNINKEQEQEQLQPFGERYQLLKGRNSTVLVFGFLYDMERPSSTIQVVPVEETIEEDWFRDILLKQKYNYDAIIVMAHMDTDDPLIDLIYEKIRSYVDPKMPIQFINGHSHTRSFTNNIKKDQYVHKLLPGGLFDTIGWVTIPKFDTAQTLDIQQLKDGTTNEFQHQFLNTSKSYLQSTLFGDDYDDDVPTLRTPKGDAISRLINDTQTKLELNQIVACPGKDFYRNVSIYDENSLWKLWRDHVVKTQIFKKNTDRVMLVSKKTFRYDLRGSGIGKHDDDAMTLDDVIAIAPYMEKVIYVGDVPDWMVRRMNNTFNTYSHHNIIPDYVLAGDLDEVKTAETYQLYTHEVDVPKIKAKL
ncbi:Metallo-dependent phosphatase, partial [Fragilariopsis cylindrus CCMP1102]